jgi:hypothetical protein
MRAAIPLLCVALLLAGCGKYGKMELSDYPNLVGNFDWTQSVIDSVTTRTTANTTDRYSFKFNKKGKVWIYKNGKTANRGYVYGIQLLENGDLNISMLLDNKKTFGMFFDGNTELYSNNYPYTAIRNTFLKQ